MLLVVQFHDTQQYTNQGVDVVIQVSPVNMGSGANLPRCFCLLQCLLSVQMLRFWPEVSIFDPCWSIQVPSPFMAL